MKNSGMALVDYLGIVSFWGIPISGEPKRRGRPSGTSSMAYRRFQGHYWRHFQVFLAIFLGVTYSEVPGKLTENFQIRLQMG